MFQAIRKNKAEFKNLAYAAGNTVKTVWDEIQDQMLESGMKISDSFEKSVHDLSRFTSLLISRVPPFAESTRNRIVEGIHALVCAYAGRGFLRRFFCSESDLGCIAEFQQELDQAKRNFEVNAISSAVSCTN